MTESLRIALLHLAPWFGEVEANRAALLEAVEAAASRDARLVLAPELAVSGYGFETRAQAASMAEAKNGPTLQALAETCRHMSIFCAVGLAEHTRARVFFTTASFS